VADQAVFEKGCSSLTKIMHALPPHPITLEKETAKISVRIGFIVGEFDNERREKMGRTRYR
jgi:hypothetical protein